MDTSGFYFVDGEDLYFGPNFVSAPTFELLRERPEDRDNDLNGSATHGWYWFDTEAEAKAFFGLD